MNYFRESSTFVLLLLMAAFVIDRAAHSTAADISIVVNFGDFPSADVAGKAEKEVNWADADVTDDTACTESYAALELQRCLRLMTGRSEDFTIVKDDAGLQGDIILVGGPTFNAASSRLAVPLGCDAEKLADLGPQGYCIKSGEVDGRRVWLIAGSSRVGTLYGVYDFLHRLGCRWFAPEEIHEEIPRIERIPAIDASESPSFQARGFWAWEDRCTPEFLVWMARNRLNYWTISEDDHALMRKLGILVACGMHDAQEMFIGPNNPYPYRHSRFEGNQDKPADPYRLSEEYRGDADNDGKLSNFEAHPEWFAWEGGKRILGIHGCGGTNYCTSNSDATAEFVKNYVQAIIDGPYQKADVINFWMLDGGRWCQCEKCKEQGTPTDRNLHVTYRFDQEIKKAQAEGKIHRPIQVRFLAYLDVIDPPTKKLPDDFDYQTCVATFYPISRCYVYWIDSGCALNRRYCNKLHGWTSAADRHYHGVVALGEYYNLSNFKCLPVCFMHSMANDIPYYYKAGVRNLDYMHVTTAEWGSKSLTNYQMARQAWDVDADCPLLWDDYFAKRYGPTASVMRKYYESLEAMLSNVEHMKGRQYGFLPALSEGKEPLFPDGRFQYRREPDVKYDHPTLVEMVEHGKTCRALLTEAMAQPASDQIKARLKEDEITFTYAERTLRYYDECVQAYRLARAGRLEEAKGHYHDARRVADLLQGDTTSTSFSSSHANDKNAFTATQATEALDRLEKLLKPSED